MGTYFGSTPQELDHFVSGIGKASIQKEVIKFRGYPFEPACVYPEKEISFQKIDEIHLGAYPLSIKIGEELIFISRTLTEELEYFAKQHEIPLVRRASNWDWITEPFLDTTFTEQQQEATFRLLRNNGISEQEVHVLRAEIAEQMFKYNFDTLLWEWGGLGLSDVLAAMRPKLNTKAFHDFYWKAMEIEQRSAAPGK